MNLSSFKLGRCLRLALLLTMLAAQGIVSAHEPDSSHSLDSHTCSICLAGHGLGDGVSIIPGVAEIQRAGAPLPARLVTDLVVSRTNHYHSRAPPLSHECQ